MKQDRVRRAKAIAALLRENAQTTPQYAIGLSVISGASMLNFTGLPRNAATALIGLVRLFI